MDADAERATQRRARSERDERAHRRRTTQDQEEINEQAALWESVQATRAVPLPPADQPDVPLPPASGFSTRLSDTVSAASRLPIAAWDWLRRRAAVAREDALIRDGGDVPIDSEDETQACIICTVNKRAAVFLPCGHCIVCNGCWHQYINTISASVDWRGGFECPSCRAYVQQVLPITQRQRDALSAGIRTLHAGCRHFEIPAGPIFMSAQMPGAPLLPILDAASA